jgi:hypothetical protein
MGYALIGVRIHSFIYTYQDVVMLESANQTSQQPHPKSSSNGRTRGPFIEQDGFHGSRSGLQRRKVDHEHRVRVEDADILCLQIRIPSCLFHDVRRISLEKSATYLSGARSCRPDGTPSHFELVGYEGVQSFQF